MTRARATASPDAMASAAPEETPAPTPEPRRGWREPHYVPVRVAVERLARRIDFPVVLPRDRLAGIRSYRGWLADPRHLDWRRRGGRMVGSLRLVSRRNDLWIYYGYASPDGCGGRDTAVPTKVLGEPALLWTYDRSSLLVWPVRPHGHTGTYGLSGSFEGFKLLRLARAMELALREAPPRDSGC
ncbi:MAG TPA: hypothetical protein VHN37_10545 [Actinomycetota bacterium]|nr:hypothetical protein [Actinomycetota bacterium]